MGLRMRASTPSGGASISSRSTATCSAAARYSTRQISTPRSPASMNCTRRRGDWKTRQAKRAERYSAHFAARDWDALAKILADDISIDDRRRVVNAGIRHGRDAEIANLRATADVGFMYITSAVIAARGERLILTRTVGPRSRVRGVPVGCAQRRRNQLRQSDRGDRHFRPRRLRCRHRRARRPLPRRRSGRLRAHMVGDRGWPRRAQPARATADHAGLRQHRPPPGGSVRAR